MIYDNKFLEELTEEVKKVAGTKYKVELMNVTKNNNIMYTGMNVMEQSSKVAPTIYLEDCYSRYLAGETVEELAEDIVTVSLEHHSASENLKEDFYCFKECKDKIVFRLINRDKNIILLSTIPYVPVYDNLALTFYVMLSKKEECIMSLQITNELLNIWKKTTEEIYQLALVNTPQLFPPKLETMGSIISKMLKNDKNYKNYTENIWNEKPKEAMYVLSNVFEINGASVIAYPDLLKQIATNWKCNFAILPSSLHEVILVPESKIKMDFLELQKMVVQVNLTEVPDEEILSSKVYYYNAEIDMVIAPLIEKKNR